MDDGTARASVSAVAVAAPTPSAASTATATAAPALALITPKDKADGEEAAWKTVLERAIKAVVTIKYAKPRTFDLWDSGSFNATGFIVSLEHALIVTNKHVASDGPFIGKAVFRNSEEVIYITYATYIFNASVLTQDGSISMLH